MHGNLISISEFARLSGITRDNLIYYDRAGILKPETVGKNGYRYYGLRQFGTAYLVLTLKEFGMPLKEIKKMAKARTPKTISHMFSEQMETVRDQIARLTFSLEMMETHIARIKQATNVDEKHFEVQELDATPIFKGSVIPAGLKDLSVECFTAFMTEVANAGLGFTLGFPIGIITSRKNLLAKQWRCPERVYMHVPKSRVKTKAGLYAIGYSRGDYSPQPKLYERLTKYIADNGYVIVGDAYEEYLLDEISTVNPEEYLCRLSIHVAKK